MEQFLYWLSNIKGSPRSGLDYLQVFRFLGILGEQTVVFDFNDMAKDIEPFLINSEAASVIFAHNHPSGDPEPSEDDLAITKRLVETGKILGIEVTDHIIVAKERFYSFKEKICFNV